MGFGKSVKTSEAAYLLGKPWIELVYFWIKKDSLFLLQGKEGEVHRVAICRYIERHFLTDTPEPEKCNRQRIFYCRRVCQAWQRNLLEKKIQSKSIRPDTPTLF